MNNTLQLLFLNIYLNPGFFKLQKTLFIPVIPLFFPPDTFLVHYNMKCVN